MQTNNETFDRNTVARLNRANELIYQGAVIVAENRDGVAHWKATDKLRKAFDRLESARRGIVEAIEEIEGDLQ